MFRYLFLKNIVLYAIIAALILFIVFPQLFENTVEKLASGVDGLSLKWIDARGLETMIETEEDEEVA